METKQVLLAYTFLSALFTCASSVNILFVVGAVSSYSHRAGLEPLAEALAEKGHNVTFLSPIKSKLNNSKVNEFCPKIMLDLHQAFIKQYGVVGLQSRLKKRKSIDLAKGFGLFDKGLAVTEALLQDSEYQDFVNRSLFDLVVIDRVTMTEVFFGLAWKLKAKLISYNALGIMVQWDYYAHGIPVEPWIPVFDVPYDSKEMSFWTRVQNELSILSWYYSHIWYYVPKIDALLKEGYGEPNMPSIATLFRNETIILANQHYSDAFPKSLPPFIIPVGGMTAKPSNGSIPQDLEAFISGTNVGFVYISFGSIITISSLPSETLQVFFDAIAKFDFKFLWKWEGELPRNGPKNILFRNWFPQNDILAHSKIRGFISQGGQVSIQQAIYHGVPLILFPVNGDQNLNAKRLEVMGNGLTLEFCGLSVSELTDAIRQLTSNPSFKNIATKLSAAAKTRPMSPLDTAVWWTEFVLSQDDMSYLKPLTQFQPWWKQRQLDVFAFIFIMVMFVIILIVTLTMLLVKAFFCALTHRSCEIDTVRTKKCS